MKKRFGELIDYVEYEDLLKLKNDIEDGGFHLKKLVEKKIKEHNTKHDQQCAVCSNILDTYSINNYTLVFGPEDFKKKASFCGIDCLGYFLTNLKKMKEAHHEHQK